MRQNDDADEYTRRKPRPLKARNIFAVYAFKARLNVAQKFAPAERERFSRPALQTETIAPAPQNRLAVFAPIFRPPPQNGPPNCPQFKTKPAVF